MRWLWQKEKSALRYLPYICSICLDSELPNIQLTYVAAQASLSLPAVQSCCLSCKKLLDGPTAAWCHSLLQQQHNKPLSFRKQLPKNSVVVTCSCFSQPGDLEHQPVHLQEIKLFYLYGTQCNIQARNVRRTNGLLKRLWTFFLLQRSLAFGGSGLITKLASTRRK